MEKNEYPRFLNSKCRKIPNEPALSSKDKSGKLGDRYIGMMYYSSVMDVAKSLLYHNIGQNDKISIYSYNRKEWNIYI